LLVLLRLHQRLPGISQLLLGSGHCLLQPVLVLGLPGVRCIELEQALLQRLLLGHASECQMDSAGRLLLAPVLRQHAGLTKQVMLVGQFNKFELWDEVTWHQQVREDIDAEQSSSEVLSERLQDLSL